MPIQLAHTHVYYDQANCGQDCDSPAPRTPTGHANSPCPTHSVRHTSMSRAQKQSIRACCARDASHTCTTVAQSTAPARSWSWSNAAHCQAHALCRPPWAGSSSCYVWCRYHTCRLCLSLARSLTSCDWQMAARCGSGCTARDATVNMG